MIAAPLKYRLTVQEISRRPVRIQDVQRVAPGAARRIAVHEGWAEFEIATLRDHELLVLEWLVLD